MPRPAQPVKTFPTVKAVAILEAMATARRPLGVSELGVLLGLPKPTAHRIVRMLEIEGLLQREPGSRRFVPGARMVQLGLGIVAASMLRAPRHAILEALSQQIGETCNFGVMSGSHVVYFDRVEFGMAVWAALRAWLARAIALHVDGQAVLKSAAGAEARVATARYPALSLHREHHHRRGQAWKRSWSGSSPPRSQPTTRNSWPAWSALPYLSAMRAGSRLRPLRCPHRSRACRCSRDCSMCRCCERQRNG